MTDKAPRITLSPEERTFKAHLRAVYNSGKVQEAYEQAKDNYTAYRDMYRKQKNSVNDLEFNKFQAEAEHIISRLNQ